MGITMEDIYIHTHIYIGLPRGHSGKEPTCQRRRHRFHLWVGRTPWRRKWQPTPVFLPGESHGQRSLAGYSQWGHKELDTMEQLNVYIYMCVCVCVCVCMCTHTHTDTHKAKLWSKRIKTKTIWLTHWAQKLIFTHKWKKKRSQSIKKN